jgi:prepilin-type N-terminal cleavage/methylation domain-containing protein
VQGCPPNRQSGFTLIEIMAVILLIGLMMGGVSIALDRFLPGQQIDGEARQMLSQLDLARSGAISAGRPYRVVVDLDEHQYWVYTPYDVDGRIAKTQEEQVAINRYVLESGVLFGGVLGAGSGGQLITEGKVEFVFPSSGITTDVILYLTSEAGDFYDKTLFLGGLTGRTSITDGHQIPGSVRDEDFDA